MKLHAIALWIIGPLAVGAASTLLGASAAKSKDAVVRDTASLGAAERKHLETLPGRAISDAAWALADVDTARKVLQRELDRLPESDGPARARTFIRFGIIDPNPDGQAAVFSLACVEDPSVCDRMKEAGERETVVRLVAPGNHLPLSLLGGHP
ncbi:MAG TPA: hypothetical protein VFQ35_05995 [Polyangiaceae bacterium]|nr:hypothetical protein [Polyangiaceae bacterium]